MRVLANFSHRDNGNSYQVSVESNGDIEMDRIAETIDQLFLYAKEAVQRQVNDDLEFPPKETEVTIPRVASGYNGNGNGTGATEKQKNFLKKLHADKRKGVNIDTISKYEASQLIKELMEV